MYILKKIKKKSEKLTAKSQQLVNKETGSPWGKPVCQYINL